MSDEHYSELACAIVDYAASRGVGRLNDHDGAWLTKVDDNIHVAVNGKPTPQHVEPEGGMAVELKPYHFAIWWNGWIAGILTSYDGTVLTGDGCNEDTLIAAIRAATAAEPKP